MSGVSRLRQSRKNHPMPIEIQPQRKGRYTGAPARGGEDVRMPKRSAEAVFKALPTTKPPRSNISPVRGEGPTRNVSTKRA